MFNFRGVTYAPLQVEHGRNKNELTPQLPPLPPDFSGKTPNRKEILRKEKQQKHSNHRKLSEISPTERDFLFATRIRITTTTNPSFRMKFHDMDVPLTQSGTVRTKMGHSGECQKKMVWLQDGTPTIVTEFFHPYKWPHKRVTGEISPL